MSSTSAGPRTREVVALSLTMWSSYFTAPRVELIFTLALALIVGGKCYVPPCYSHRAMRAGGLDARALKQGFPPLRSSLLGAFLSKSSRNLCATQPPQRASKHVVAMARRDSSPYEPKKMLPLLSGGNLVIGNDGWFIDADSDEGDSKAAVSDLYGDQAIPIEVEDQVAWILYRDGLVITTITGCKVRPTCNRLAPVVPPPSRARPPCRVLGAPLPPCPRRSATGAGRDAEGAWDDGGWVEGVWEGGAGLRAAGAGWWEKGTG